MSKQTKTFSAVGSDDSISVAHGGKVYYSVTGTYAGTVKLEQSFDKGASWSTAVAVIADTVASGTIDPVNHRNRDRVLYRWTSSVYTSGSPATTVLEIPAQQQTKVFNAGVLSKVGGAAGFVVGAASNICLATCPASQTAAKLVIPLSGFKTGDLITSAGLIGQIESGGNAATVDLEIRKHTAAAADVADASVATATQLSVTADTIMSASNIGISNLAEEVTADVTYYAIVTVTTAASTDIALQGISVGYVSAPPAS